MSHCFNPNCPHPDNSAMAEVCQGCGHSLWLAGRYRALQVLGQSGGDCTVLAESRLPESPTVKQVVIRQIYGPAVQGSDADFQATAERWRQWGQHPQLPTLVEAFATQWGWFWVQTYIPGLTLAQILAQAGPFTLEQVQTLLQTLLPVLEYIHSFRIIHRQITPEHILQPSQGKLPMLINFGALKYLSNQPLARSRTAIGSAEYVAPEQALGRAEFASDLYSLGVVCLHVLTGVSPFDLYSISEERWVWRDYLSPALATRSGVKLGRILDKLVARSLAERYATASQVSLDLQALGPGLALSWLQPGGQPRMPLPPNLPRWPTLPPLYERRYQLTAAAGVSLGVTTVLAVSPDGQILATGSEAGRLWLWQLATGDCLQRLGQSFWGQGHRDRVTGLGFHPTGQWLYSVSADATLKVWDVQTGELVQKVPLAGRVPTALGISRQGFLLMGASDGCLTLWQLEPLTQVRTLTQHQDTITALAGSARGDCWASASWDRTLRLWQLPQGNLLQTFKVEGQRVTALAMHPTGQWVLSGDDRYEVKVWHGGLSPTGDRISADVPVTICTLEAPITALALSYDARLVAVGTEGNVLTIWRGTNGECLARLDQGWGMVAIAFSPNDYTLISSSRDETVSVWQVRKQGKAARGR